MVLVSLVLACSSPVPEPNGTWARFEADTPAWTALGTDRSAVEAAPDGELALHLTSVGNSAIGAPDPPADWSGSRALRFRAYRSPELRGPPTALEVRVGNRETGSIFVRQIELAHTGWAEITLPLAWFRPRGAGRAPRWDRVTDFVLRFDGPTDLWLDELELVPGEGPSPSSPSPSQIAALALAPGSVRILRTEAVDLVTDAPDLDLDALAAHLGQVRSAIRADLPFLEEEVSPPMLVVTASRETQLRLIERLVDAVGARLADEPDGGYTLLGVATASWDPDFGTLRPVYTHEYVHSVLDRTRALPDTPHDWVNEGLASLYQLRFHPGAAPSDRDPGEHPDLREVFRGGDVTNRGGGYLRAEAAVELLLHDPRYSPAVPALFESFARARSTALGPALGPILGVDEERFTEDWAARLRQRAAP